MKAYKGFRKHSDGTLQCRDKTYRVGETYTEDEAKLCQAGMHACLAPIDVLSYYPPAESVYHEVEVGDDAAESGENYDSKVVTKTLAVGAELGIQGLVEAQVEYTVSHAASVDGGHTSKHQDAASATAARGAASATAARGAASATAARGAASATADLGAASATGYQGAASATGYRGAASATGDLGAASATAARGVASATGVRGAASATGDLGVASATGVRCAASATGDRGAASATGVLGVASATGDWGVASAAGDYGVASATGVRGAASATGDWGAASATGEHSIAHADGLESSAKGALGCALTLAERNDNGELLEIAAVIVGRTYDGVTIEPDTYYQLVDGQIEVAE